jgi:hypothetical protein
MKERSRLMRSIRTFLPFVIGGLLGLVTACGSSTGVQASIGPSGGSLSMESPAVRFDVPAGALSTETMVTLRASADPSALLVTLEPAQLTLAKPGQLSVSMAGARHISGVTEVTLQGEQPIGVDTRIEDASGASARLSLDHLTRVRVSTADVPDGGTAPGACRDHRDGDDDDGEGHHDGEDGDGGHHDGEDGDGGHHDGEHHGGGMQGDAGPDGGVVGASECPAGFECDDGVCVAHGGNHEHDDDCRGVDGGTCPDDDDHDGDHDGDHRDGGHP